MPRSRSTSDCGGRTSPAAGRTPRCSARRASSTAEDADAIDAGLDAIAAEYAPDGVAEDLGARGHPHACRGAAGRADRPGRRAAAHRALAQRPGRDRLSGCGCATRSTRSIAGLAALGAALLARAEEHAATVMPGFTHLQVAQPVTLGHHLMAYDEMVARDRSRFADARARLNECPLGSAALAGTGFPIDRAATAAALGFDRPTANSLDAVSDRDFALEYLHAAALTALHLSRLAEEIILWASQPFGFVTLPDAWSTGSSIMPQKRNPDAAELVRGHAGRIDRLPDRADGDDEGPAARLFEGHAGRQAAGVRGARPARAVPRGDDRDGRDARPSARADARRGGERASRPRPTLPTGWCARRACRSARRITSPAARSSAAEAAGVGLADAAARRRCRRSIRGSTRGVYDVLSVERSVASRTSFGGTAPDQCPRARSPRRAAA